MVLAISTFDDRALSRLGLDALHRLRTATGLTIHRDHRDLAWRFWSPSSAFSPIRNMLSPGQVMNTVYNRLHLVGTYGAFGSITRPRYEVIVEGTDEAVADTVHQMARVRIQGQTGQHRPPAAADRALPSAARLADVVRGTVLVQSAALVRAFSLRNFSKATGHARSALHRIRSPISPPRYVRAQLYEYHFTTPEERAASGQWWRRQLIRPYFPAVSLDAFQGVPK